MMISVRRRFKKNLLKFYIKMNKVKRIIVLGYEYLKPISGVPTESMRLRFALLQSLNSTLETFFLPLVDLRPTFSSSCSQSVAALLSEARGLVFFDTKMMLLKRVLNATAQRRPDQAAPEITLDPLDGVAGRWQHFPFSVFLIWGRRIKFSFSMFSGLVLPLSVLLSPSCLRITSLHLSFGLSIFRCPFTSVFHVLITTYSSSLLMTSTYHFNLLSWIFPPFLLSL